MPYSVLWADITNIAASKQALYNKIETLALASHNHNLVDLNEKNHTSLTNVLTNQHHAKTVSGEISLAALLEKDHTSLTNVLTNQHHAKTVSGEISLAALLEKDHASLTNVLTNQHHTKYTLEVHNNDKHDPNYEVEFSKNSAFNKNFGIIVNSVCQGNDSRLQNALKIKGKTIDDTALGDNKVLKYDLASTSWKCEDDIGGDGGTILVDRGNTDVYDFVKTDLINDLNFNDLDLSGIIDEGSIEVLIRVAIKDQVANSYIMFRKNGETGTKNYQLAKLIVANTYPHFHFWVSVDSNRKCEIKCSPVPLSWDNIDIVILKWRKI